METTTYNRPDVGLKTDTTLSDSYARNYGLGLGIITSLYLLILNLTMDDPSTGLRFAKHLLIIPVVWLALASYTKLFPSGKAFKSDLGLLLKLGLWAAMTIVVLNALVYAFSGISFEQFMQEGNTMAGMMINSGFLLFETLVFVMIIGFVILQAYKGKGSPED